MPQATAAGNIQFKREKDVLSATDSVSRAQKDMEPNVKLTSAKLDEVVAAEAVEAIKLKN